MLSYIKANQQFLFLLMTWVLSAIFFGQLASVIVLLCIFIFIRKDWMEEFFIGFLIILIMSDSLLEPIAFAKSFKNIYILILAFYFFLNAQTFPYQVRTYVYFLPFLFFALVGIFYSPVPETSIQKWLSYALLFVVVPNYVVKGYSMSGTLFLKNLIYTIFLVCLVGFSFNFINPEISISHGERFRGVFGNPNGLGIFLIIFTLLFSVINSLYPNLFSKKERLLIIFAILFFVIITGSRNALLAILLFYLFSYLFRISVLLGFLGFLIAVFLTEYITTNFISIISNLGLAAEFRVETLQEGSGRLLAWDFAWLEIKRSFFIGRGLGYDEYYMRKNFETLSQLGHEGGVHNTYLILWLNSGLMGLLSFFVSYITLFVKASFKNKLAFPVMITVLFSIIFEPWLAASLNPYTILFLVVLTLLTEDVFLNNEINKTIANDEAVKENAFA
jgi:O-antigen ligase